MTRVKTGSVTRVRHKKVLKQAKGYFGSKHRLYRTAKEQVMHSSVYAYRDRKQNKRNFRKLWITRINAACRENNISYSKFINGLNKAELLINRKMLSELAIDNPKAFSDLVAIAVDALNGKEYKPKEIKVKEQDVTKKTVIKEKPTVKKEPNTTTETKKTSTTKKSTAKKPVVKKEPKKVSESKKTDTIKKSTVKKPAVKKEPKTK
jgi:large subunit ribosomal protein L20